MKNLPEVRFSLPKGPAHFWGVSGSLLVGFFALAREVSPKIFYFFSKNPEITWNHVHFWPANQKTNKTRTPKVPRVNRSGDRASQLSFLDRSPTVTDKGQPSGDRG